MKINLIAIGKSLPNWINLGFAEYAKRLPKDYQLNLLELTAAKRTKNSDLKRIIAEESAALLNAVPKNNIVIALDEHGQQFSTVELAQRLAKWHDEQQDISLLVGGPDGLSAECLAQAQSKWSLSKLTLPHPLVRLIVAEQIYRAWSIIVGHPYHRTTI